MAAPAQGGGIDIGQLPLPQLLQVKKQMEAEIDYLKDSITQLNEAEVRYTNSRESLEHLRKSTTGTPALVPLASSLYVPATIDEPERVMIDIGTGYFVKMSGDDYIARRLKMIKDQNTKAVAAHNSKMENLQVLRYIIEDKMQKQKVAK